MSFECLTKNILKLSGSVPLREDVVGEDFVFVAAIDGDRHTIGGYLSHTREKRFHAALQRVARPHYKIDINPPKLA
jgi:uncharacterized protein YfaA (DUF2138 family)